MVNEKENVKEETPVSSQDSLMAIKKIIEKYGGEVKLGDFLGPSIQKQPDFLAKNQDGLFPVVRLTFDYRGAKEGYHLAVACSGSSDINLNQAKDYAEKWAFIIEILEEVQQAIQRSE